MTRLFASKRVVVCLVLSLAVLLILPFVFAQETTAGLQGTVKDTTGAVVTKATVEVAGSALIGVKKMETDQGGYYRFANLPPGEYTITVTASGFKTYKQGGIELLAGHLPTIDLALQIGAVAETVEVTGAAPLVDVSQSKVQTNLPTEVLDAVPKGRSFQSVIQFAPGARSEPLQGGYQIDGASNSENSYLVEGQETSAIRTGASGTDVPMEFIQEVQIKSSGFEAEYGGALGGVVNVIQKRGGNTWHGSLFTYFNNDMMDAAPNRYLRYDPSGSRVGLFDYAVQTYQPKKDHYTTNQPGFEVGGYLLKDKLWLFTSAAPNIYNWRRQATFNNPYGKQTFYYDSVTYHALSRVDYLLTQKIRLFGSWQDQYYKANGTAYPNADDVFGLTNASASNNPANYNHQIGNVQPRQLWGAGADITITPTLVATARYGRLYYDYQDRGLPVGLRYIYRSSNYPYPSVGAPASLPEICATPGSCPTLGTVMPSSVNTVGWYNISANSQYLYDKYSRNSWSGDLAWFKKAMGTHNVKFGWSMNRLWNDVINGYNTSQAYIAWGTAYSPATATGRANCATIRQQNLTNYGAEGTPSDSTCMGLWGTYNIREYGEFGQVHSNNQAFYAQDAWTIGKGITLNLGVRFDKEDVPSYAQGPGYYGIDFGWGQKVAPRLGGSWDLFGNGKVKVYGSYGWFYDIMKYEMPRGSFGGNYWHDCVYALDTPDYTQIQPTRGANGHFCNPTGGGNGNLPGRFIENQDFRTYSNTPASDQNPLGRTIDPNLKPMKQHEYVAGADFALRPNLAFETRYSRKRLDRTIEDAGLFTDAGEQYYIVNPGEGINSSISSLECTGCPPNPKASRRYDGVEFRLTKRQSGNWFGSFSYTYSRLYGNYSGLTATDVSDGGAARQSPNVDRAFDEPFMQFDANGQPIDGPLATDRPHTFKAYGYYRVKVWKLNTWLGAYQQIYSGTPLSTYVSIWGAPVFIDGRGKFVPMSQDSSGVWQAGTPIDKRTPKFSQTDLNLREEFGLSKTNEAMKLAVELNITNLFNQRSAMLFSQDLLDSVGGNVDPYPCNYVNDVPQAPCPSTSSSGIDYKALLAGYNAIGQANAQGMTLSNFYGKATGWQGGRGMRLGLKFTF